MPISYEIDQDARLIHVRAWGELTKEEAVGSRRRMMADPDFDPSASELIDLTDVTGVNMDSAEVSDLTRTDPWTEESRRAMIAPTDLLYGLARMYSMLLGDSSEVEIFRTRKEAEAWLQTPSDHDPHRIA